MRIEDNCLDSLLESRRSPLAAKNTARREASLCPSPVRLWHFAILWLCLTTSVVLVQMEIARQTARGLEHLLYSSIKDANAFAPAYVPPHEYNVADGNLETFIENNGKVTLVLVNYERPANIRLIADNATTYDIVDEIIVWDNRKLFDHTFRYDHPKVRIVRAPEFEPFEHWGTLGRFQWALTAANENIIIQDDTVLLREAAIATMLAAKAEYPDRLICHMGREVTDARHPDVLNYNPREARAGTVAPVCLNNVLLTDRRFCLHTVRVASVMRDLVNLATPFWSGDDIVNSLAAVELTGKLHYVIELEHNDRVELPAMAFATLADADDFRTHLTREVARRLDLSADDLKPQSNTGYTIPSRADPPVPIFGETEEATLLPATLEKFEGKKDICILSLSAGGYGEFGSNIADNHQAYAAHHGYPYWVYQGRVSGDELRSSVDGNITTHRGGAMHWQKLPATKTMLQAKQKNGRSLCKWVMWIDSDAFFTNFKKPLEPIIEAFGGAGHTAPEAKTAIFSREEAGGTSINSGVFFVRNSLAGHRMLETLIGMFSDYKIPTENRRLHDQDAIHDYVFDKMPETPKYNLDWNDIYKHTRADLALAPQRLFNSFDRLRQDPDVATWHPCDHIAHISASDSERRLKRFAQLSQNIDKCTP